MVPYWSSLAAATAASKAIPLGVASLRVVTTWTDQTVSKRDVRNHPVEPNGAVSETFREQLPKQEIHPAIGAQVSVVTERERETRTSLHSRLARPL